MPGVHLHNPRQILFVHFLTVTSSAEEWIPKLLPDALRIAVRALNLQDLVQSALQ